LHPIRELTPMFWFVVFSSVLGADIAQMKSTLMLGPFGTESLTARIPWSVQLSDIIKVGMRSSRILLRMTMSRCFCSTSWLSPYVGQLYCPSNSQAKPFRYVLTDPRQFDILHSGLGWWGPNATRPIETTRLHHAARQLGGRVAARGACPLIEEHRHTGFKLSLTRSHNGG